jgi:hypothetical protein
MRNLTARSEQIQPVAAVVTRLDKAGHGEATLLHGTSEPYEA